MDESTIPDGPRESGWAPTYGPAGEVWVHRDDEAWMVSDSSGRTLAVPLIPREGDGAMLLRSGRSFVAVAMVTADAGALIKALVRVRGATWPPFCT